MSKSQNLGVAILAITAAMAALRRRAPLPRDDLACTRCSEVAARRSLQVPGHRGGYAGLSREG